MNISSGGNTLQRCCSPPWSGGSLFLRRVDSWGRTICGRAWWEGGQVWMAGHDYRNRKGMRLNTQERGSILCYTGGSLCRALETQRCRAIGEAEDIYGSELQGFALRVATCNQGRERKGEFLPFRVGKDTLGYIHYSFAEHLKRFPKVFYFEGLEVSSFQKNGISAIGSVKLAESLSSLQRRTAAVQGVLEVLKGDGLIPGWRNELLPIMLSYGTPPFLLMERAAVPLFGAKAYGVHMNGYVNTDGEKFLWVAKRSSSKSTFPGMLDHIVAGGQPEGISAKDNVIKECDEEAGIPSHLARKAVPVGAVSYDVIKGETYKRDVLFCYDLELPIEFEPYNKDGEVETFYRLPVTEVVDIIRNTDRYKPNCALVVIDFLYRHGYITPEHKGYLPLLQSLRTGEL